ncbi:sporulation protein Cse60 [Acinetobacter proteolyticus]|uniref:sporulation protein Cse60 n=1 Tax=Acinetobacter proteolyticus TaxID=1776741 RepID=UPI003D973B4B
MAKVKTFETESIQDLEQKINDWLRAELISNNHKVNIKALSHDFFNERSKSIVSAVIVYEYV